MNIADQTQAVGADDDTRKQKPEYGGQVEPLEQQHDQGRKAQQYQ